MRTPMTFFEETQDASPEVIWPCSVASKFQLLPMNAFTKNLQLEAKRRPKKDSRKLGSFPVCAIAHAMKTNEVKVLPRHAIMRYPLKILLADEILPIQMMYCKVILNFSTSNDKDVIDSIKRAWILIVSLSVSLFPSPYPIYLRCIDFRF